VPGPNDLGRIRRLLSAPLMPASLLTAVRRWLGRVAVPGRAPAMQAYALKNVGGGAGS